MSAFLKHGERYVPDARDLDPLQLSVRAANTELQMRAQQHAANTDPIKRMLDGPHYQQYDRRIEDAWKHPAPVTSNGGEQT